MRRASSSSATTPRARVVGAESACGSPRPPPLTAARGCRRVPRRGGRSRAQARGGGVESGSRGGPRGAGREMGGVGGAGMQLGVALWGVAVLLSAAVLGALMQGAAVAVRLVYGLCLAACLAILAAAGSHLLFGAANPQALQL